MGRKSNSRRWNSCRKSGTQPPVLTLKKGWNESVRAHQMQNQTPTTTAFTVFPAGASAYLRDLPNAELHLIDAGHFAVEENAVEMAKYITLFLEKRSGP